MPATVIHDDPPAISAQFTDGSSCTVRIRDSKNPALARELLLGLADLVKPHGDLDSTGSVQGYTTAIRHLCDKLAELGFTGTAAELTRGRLSEHWLGTAHPANEQKARAMLLRLDDIHSVLKPDVRGLVAGRSYSAHLRDKKPLPPYSEGEWARLTEACQRIVKLDFGRFKDAMAAAGRGRDPYEGGWSVDNVRWAMATWGPIEAAPVVSWRRDHPSGLSVNSFPYQAVKDTEVLFPNTGTIIAYRVLLGIYSGIVPDGLADLGLGDVDWAGDTTVLLDYVKGRTAPESLVLSRRASRLLQQWLEHSAPSRRFAPPDLKDKLWVRHTFPLPTRWTARTEDSMVLIRWARGAGLLDDQGRPLQIHRHRIRTTHGAMRDRRTWRGSRRSTIDPNRSPLVEGDHYLTLGTEAQREMVDDVIADAQMDMLRRAQPPVVLTDESMATLVRDYPEQVAALNLTDEVLTELLSGQRDVFSASCADQLSGLHGPKGKPCPARPWVCLACPLALFTPRHLPNLMRLRAFFSAMWQEMTSAEFMAVFGFYSQRLDSILTPGVHFSAESLARAAAQVADTDEELPLRAEERTVR
ncbi:MULTISPECIES: hypothetical protein [Kitasatospora]|uniref:Integrase n=1 Tax=Kitasatospora setae (strain ATCC 33774 / DSM 43861 / JCM 3304 / KCC A-0304 / NBRC 14216 / KM-6054) TaxID=452652 RepID=E4NDJ9_KITSK|nr:MULTISPECIES: hypothetical protein [Kitasatospora]BAJ29280.1 hypothetical protein KSE_34730 [Kitasatospora setae KM-6054]